MSFFHYFFFLKHQFLFPLPRQVLSTLYGAVKPSIVNEATGGVSTIFVSEITKILKLSSSEKPSNLFEIEFVFK